MFYFEINALNKHGLSCMYPYNYNRQALKPCSSSSLSRFFPINTSLFTLASSAPHSLSGEPWNMSWTPCNNARLLKTKQYFSSTVLMTENYIMDPKNRQFWRLKKHIMDWEKGKWLDSLPEKQIARSCHRQIEDPSFDICPRFCLTIGYLATC